MSPSGLRQSESTAVSGDPALAPCQVPDCVCNRSSVVYFHSQKPLRTTSTHILFLCCARECWVDQSVKYRLLLLGLCAENTWGSEVAIVERSRGKDLQGKGSITINGVDYIVLG